MTSRVARLRSWAIVAFLVGLAIFVPMVIWVISTVKREEIHEAVRDGDIRRVKAILDRSPELLEQRSRADFTPLLEATRGGQVKALEVLIKRGANVNAEWNQVATGDGNWNALHIAANWDEVESAKVLLKAGTNVNAKTLKGETPLDVAVRNSNTRLADLIRENGGKSGKQ